MLRIDIRDKLFNDGASSKPTYDGVIINAAPISRSYYKEDFSQGKLNLPTCWSSDTQRPSPDVPENSRQSVRCMDCKYNIRGSGHGSSRACRFSQRVAVLPEGDLTRVYQLRLPATSIWGSPRDGNLPMQEYARFLKTHDTASSAVITQMYFDDDSATPKLFFKPKRPLTEEEFAEASGMVSHADTIRAITLEFTPFAEPVSPFAEADGFQTNKQGE